MPKHETYLGDGLYANPCSAGPCGAMGWGLVTLGG